MPSSQFLYTISTYESATDLPPHVWDAFQASPRDSNIMYPHALRARQQEADGRPSTGIWIVCSTPHLLTRQSPSVDFVLSCTEGSLGQYPIFIFTPISPAHLDHDFIAPRLESIASALRQAVPTGRVFSVFAVDAVTIEFTSIWSRMTGVPLAPQPDYYAAKGTYCTQRTFRPRSPSLFADMDYELRLARDADVAAAAELCYGFAAESEPFTLTKEEAQREASLLIAGRQLWVHEVRQPGRSSELASIVAVTRTSETVAAITKVYTNPRWRKRGCAERLTRKVTKHLLKTKESVVLYVAHNNPAAAKVYDRVGFVGISPNGPAAEGVHSWLELGFDTDIVQLGHW